jgi:hypothetical protein
MTKAKSGGGITSNKNVRPPIKAGPPRADKIAPGGAAQLGSSVIKNPSPLIKGTMAKPELGNANALRGLGVGGGRTVHRAGSQSPTPQAVPISGDKSQWPDKREG